MKKTATVTLAAAVLILCMGCQTVQFGASYEPRETSHVIGGYMGGDSGDSFIENNFIYVHNAYPETEGIDAHGVGYDFTIKIPISFARNHFSIFPMAGFESRYFFSTSKPEEGALLPPPEKNKSWGFGLKFGGGLDISFSSAWYLRGTALYQPEATTYMNSYPGWRFNAALGYRTDDDRIRQGYSSFSKSSSKSKEEKSQPVKLSREEELEQAVATDPGNASLLYDLGWHRYSNGKNVTAAAAWENTLKLDPNYRVNDEKAWTASTASNYGVAATESIKINNFSLLWLLATAYYDAATKTGTNSDNVVGEKDKNAALEKALALYCSGYDIDIEGGKNNSKNLKTVYLASIAKTLDLLGRKDVATAAYIELAKTAKVTVDVSLRVSTASYTGQSYFVSANGDNNNNGLSKDKPLRSLSAAYQKAAAGSAKRIVVIGKLNYQSEGVNDNDAVFYLDAPKPDKSEILITGMWGAEKAVLSGAGSKKNVVNVSAGTVRFEHIEISGGELNEKGKEGNGIDISSTAAIGTGAVVRTNKGRGVEIFKGTGVLAGGEINNNESGGVGILLGTFNMESGSIKNNKSAENGGGVYIMSGTFTMSGGTISGNTTNEGGGVYVSISLGDDTVFTMTDGTITGNTAATAGGGVSVSGVKEELKDGLKGGTFRQSGGSITGNSAKVGGGVFVSGFNSRYYKTGGTVSGNKATHYLNDALPGSNSDITRDQGSLGSGR